MKKYRVVVHMDGTYDSRGTERGRDYLWAVVRELPEGAMMPHYNGRGYDEIPLPRFEVVSWRSNLTDAVNYAAKKTGSDYLGYATVYTVASTTEVPHGEKVADTVARVKVEQGHV